MSTDRNRITRTLTLRYLFALVIVGILATANFWVLRAEIRANELSVELLSLSGRQRTWLQSTALLAQGLVSIRSPEEREPLRGQLREAIEALRTAHHRLIEFDPTGEGAASPVVREIYESGPWFLDTEIRNYLSQLRELSEEEEDSLTLFNPHYRYVREVALRGEVMKGLEAVVTAYRRQMDQRAARLRRLAQFSLVSTMMVLTLAGVTVFRPMVRRVRADMDALQVLNQTLEDQVAERTAEAERKARELAASESLYHSLVETLPLGVARTGQDGRFTYVNELYCEMTGRTRDAVIDRSADEIFPSEIAETLRRNRRRVLDGGNPVQAVLKLTLPAGGGRVLEVLETPVEDADRNVVGTQIVLWDITERKAAEERMLHAERLAAVGEMVAGVAHESRNALQQVGACAKMLEWESGSGSESIGLISDIQNAHDRLRRLFDNLGGFVSPLNLDRRVVNLSDIFQGAWKSTANERSKRDVLLEHRNESSDLRCSLDPFQMEQVFRNILENALAVCVDPVRIRVCWRDVRLHGLPAIEVSVADNGPGIPPEVKDRIFHPFFTTRTRGTGLGMAIVRRIIDAHGGHIEISDPRDGIGALIVITMPREFS